MKLHFNNLAVEKRLYALLHRRSNKKVEELMEQDENLSWSDAKQRVEGEIKDFLCNDNRAERSGFFKEPMKDKAYN